MKGRRKMFSSILIFILTNIIFTINANPIEKRKDDLDKIDFDLIEGELFSLKSFIAAEKENYARSTFNLSYKDTKIKENDQFLNHAATHYLHNDDDNNDDTLSNVSRAWMLSKKLHALSEKILKKDEENQLWNKTVSSLSNIEERLGGGRFYPYNFTLPTMNDDNTTDFVVLRHIDHFVKHLFHFRHCFTSKANETKWFLVKCR